MAHLACPRLTLAAVLLLALSAPPTAPDAPDEWQDPAVSGRNREPAHATMLPYATVEQALEGTREASPFYLSLNTGAPGGRGWKFHYVAKPADRPRDFHRTDFDDRGWAEIKVPSNWQLQGYDKPIYLNTRYPWAPENPQPPTIPPDYNPVGSYRDDVRGPRRLGRPPGVPALRGRQQRLPPVGQRPVGGLQRGQHDRRRVRRDALPEGGREPPGRAGLPVVGRQLPRGPGHLAPLRHLPRRLPLLDPGSPHLRLRACAPTSTRPTATRRCSFGRGCGPTTARRAEGFTVEAQLFDAERRPVLAAAPREGREGDPRREVPAARHEPVRPPRGEGKGAAPLVGGDAVPLHPRPLPEGRRRAPSCRRRARGSASARWRCAASGSS